MITVYMRYLEMQRIIGSNNILSISSHDVKFKVSGTDSIGSLAGVRDINRVK